MEKGHIFYTGPLAQSKAIEFARQNNMQTIDMTELGEYTTEWCQQIKKAKIEKEGWTEQEFWQRIGRQVWESMSRSFAFSTPTHQKVVYVFIERDYYKSQKKYQNPTAGVLHSVEHPALKALGKNIHVYLV